MDVRNADRRSNADGRRGRGRQRSEKRKLTHLVGVRLSAGLHSRLESAARGRSESTASLARRILAAALKHEAPSSVSRSRKRGHPDRMTEAHRAVINFLGEMQLVNARLGKLEQSGLRQVDGSCDQFPKLFEEVRDLLLVIVRTIRESR